jgi:hypothetical protein
MSLLMKPGNLEIIALCRACQAEKADSEPGRTFAVAIRTAWTLMEFRVRFPSFGLRELRKDPVRAEGQTVETDPRRIGQSIAKGRGHGNNRGFTRGFCAKRTVDIVGISKENLGSGNIGEGRNPVITKRGIQHFPGGVEDHALEQTASDTLRNRPFDLPATLHRIEDHAGIRGMNTLQNANLPGNPVNGDAKAMHIKAGGAR